MLGTDTNMSRSASRYLYSRQCAQRSHPARTVSSVVIPASHLHPLPGAAAAVADPIRWVPVGSGLPVLSRPSKTGHRPHTIPVFTERTVRVPLPSPLAMGPRYFSPACSRARCIFAPGSTRAPTGERPRLAMIKRDATLLTPQTTGP